MAKSAKELKTLTLKDFKRFCQEAGLKLELFEQRKGLRLHSVMRKKQKENGTDFWLHLRVGKV